MKLPEGLSYRQQQLHVEDLACSSLIQQWGTPLYVYSHAALLKAWRQYHDTLKNTPHRVCYAVKANGNLSILNQLARWGAGFDIVSAGELQRCLQAEADPQKIVFSGVGKTKDEIIMALQAGIGCFNVESEAELILLNTLAGQLQQKAPVSLRVNPDVDPQTHPYISTGLSTHKFGIDLALAKQLYLSGTRFQYIDWIGMDCHIGSQITTLAPFVDALQCLLSLYDELYAHGVRLHHLDVGGGLGVAYQSDITICQPKEWLSMAQQMLGSRPLTLIFEPGRSLVAEAGILLSEVLFIKPQQNISFAVLDAGMNDLIRPALYQAWHDIIAVEQSEHIPSQRYTIVGPVCESSDVFGQARELRLQAGSHVAILHAGAYGMSMASHYNARLKPAEVMVAGDKAHLIRARETWEDLYHHEIKKINQA